jgi:hypothetical protein
VLARALREIDTYHVAHIESHDTPRVTLLRNGTAAGLTLEGATLLAQFETAGAHVLLVLDEDTPYEETLHFYLIGKGMIIDHVTFGGAYTPGIFTLKATLEDRLCFTFANDDVYSLQVHPVASRFGRRLTTGARRPAGWLAPKYMSLERYLV